jgi:hypothetical protein
MFYVKLKINNIICVPKLLLQELRGRHDITNSHSFGQILTGFHPLHVYEKIKNRRVILTRLCILRHAPDVRPRERLSRIFAQAYLKTAILTMPFQYYAQ